jgi:hypothetical protein
MNPRLRQNRVTKPIDSLVTGPNRPLPQTNTYWLARLLTVRQMTAQRLATVARTKLSGSAHRQQEAMQQCVPYRPQHLSRHHR